MITIENIRTRPRKMTKGRYPKPRLYFFIKGETILDNLQNRRARPSDLYREVLGKIYEKLEMDPKTKAVWSQKAGCSCGCSPGFIIQGHYDKNIFVDVS